MVTQGGRTNNIRIKTAITTTGWPSYLHDCRRSTFRNDHVIWPVEGRLPPSQERHHFLPSGDKTSSKVIYRSVDLCHPANPLLLLTAVFSYPVTQPAFYCPYRAIGSNPLKSRSTSTNTRCQLRNHKFLQFRQVEVGLPIPHHHLPPPT